MSPSPKKRLSPSQETKHIGANPQSTQNPTEGLPSFYVAALDKGVIEKKSQQFYEFILQLTASNRTQFTKRRTPPNT
jgi:hypothetical protein